VHCSPAHTRRQLLSHNIAACTALLPYLLACSAQVELTIAHRASRVNSVGGIAQRVEIESGCMSQTEHN